MIAINLERLPYAALFTEGAFQDWIDKHAGDYLHDLIGKGAESQIIDAAVGVGHRLKAGHDLQGFLEIMGEEGLDGAAKWFQHMFADLMSPHGIPLPGASKIYRFLEDTVAVKETRFINWGCVSATDLVGAGLTLLLLARMHKLAEGQRIRRLITLTISQVLLISFVTANPFFVATISIQSLLTRHEWKKWQLKRLEGRLALSRKIADDTARLLERAKG